jgi:hypothetical protein
MMVTSLEGDLFLDRIVESDVSKSKAESGQRKVSPDGVDNPPGLTYGLGAHRTPEHGRRFRFLKARLGQAGTKFEIRSTKSETNSNVQKNNDPNRVGHDLSWFFGISVIPSFGFVSDFVLRIYNAACHLKIELSPFRIEFHS